MWTDGEVKCPRRLMMLIAVERDEPKIQALSFSYAGFALSRARPAES